MKTTFATILLCASSALLSQVPTYFPAEGLLGFYSLDGTALDGTGNGFDGTVHGATPATDRYGNEGGALEFSVSSNGGWGAAQQRVVIESPQLSENNGFSLVSWVFLEEKPAPFSNRPHMIMGMWDGNGDAVFRHGVTYEGELFLNLNEVGVFWGDQLSYGQWHHVVVTYDGNVLNQYLDGMLSASHSAEGGHVVSETDLTFGELHMANGHWYLLDGRLDECAYYGRALSGGEVFSIYAPTQGCMDEAACNYDATANVDDASSCIYALVGDNCEAGALACGEGLFWDATSQTCIIANPSDTDFDGCVGMTDLLDLLSTFGVCNEIPWSCGDPLEYQGYDYETVQIGEQCWFAENLRSMALGDGTPIDQPGVEGWSTASHPAGIVYGTDGATCYSNAETFDGCDEEYMASNFGLLYNWYAAVSEGGLCPSGWHVSSSVDWSDLENWLSASGMDASDLASQVFWTSSWGTNATGFNAIPGGDFSGAGDNFAAVGFAGYWWTPGEALDQPFLHHIDHENPMIQDANTNPHSGRSVRCIKD